MSKHIVIHANARSDRGKGASRRLRRSAGLVPAIIYGGSDPAQAISVEHKEILKATENEAFFSSVLDIDVDGSKVQTILKDLQRHPAKPAILHADFQRVDMKKIIHINVPLHFINEEHSPGVKLEGGLVQHNMVEVEVSCLPGNLPEYIEVDMSEVHLGDILHISDLKLPEGVESVALQHGEGHDLPVASLFTPKGGDEEEAGGDEEEAATDDDTDDSEDTE